jgi:hypothetical protein
VKANVGEGVWRVFLGEEVLGEIEVEGYDEPYNVGGFRAGPIFESVRHLFDAEAALDSEHGEPSLWDAVYAQIRARGLRLVAPDGSSVAHPILHVTNGRARFRYFEEAPPPGYQFPITAYMVEQTRADGIHQLGAFTSQFEAERLMKRLAGEGVAHLHVNVVSVHRNVADWEWDR